MGVVSSIWQRTTGEEDVLHYDIIIFFDYEMTSVNAMRCGVGGDGILTFAVRFF